jgi:hypothetical protein
MAYDYPDYLNIFSLITLYKHNGKRWKAEATELAFT